MMLGLIFLICSQLLLTSEGSVPPEATPTSTLVLLDVDNTLYVEKEAGIEAQIVKNTHAFCRDKLDISTSQADALYHEYGSTVEGLRQTMWKNYDTEKLRYSLQDFYKNVYQDIDMTHLLLTSGASFANSTGYSHAQQDRRLLCQLLQHCPFPITLASNSPSWHVQKVLQYMGLYHVAFAETLTPDRFVDFPTKHEPTAFFKESKTVPNTFGRILFFDDSQKNLDQVSAALNGIIPVHVNSRTKTLSGALMRHLGLLDSEYEFDVVKYLESKNIVDSQAINVDIWNQVIVRLQETITKKGSIEIVDVGAGRLNILSLMLNGDVSRNMSAFLDPGTNLPVTYTAYESNTELWQACDVQLKSQGFQLVKSLPEMEHIYSKDNWTVRLILRRFDEEHGGVTSPDLIVGCCFADLVDPNILVHSLLRTFHLLDDASKGTLLYFPITFAGCTQFLPPQPFQPSKSSSKMIPSDTLAFQIYAKALTETMGHNLDPLLLEKVMEGHGAKLISRGASNWKIDPTNVPYLFDTMLYFFGSTAGPPLLESGLDAVEWIKRARLERPKIQVSNVDLLFQIGGVSSKDSDPVVQSEATVLQEIQFTAPNVVTTVERIVPELGPDEVLKLKVFKGQFEDAALDVNIKGMENERMAYPLSYGYCLVGRIVKCGKNVSEKEYLGQLAFTFAAHATHVVASVEGLQLVPFGISAEDAIFMPSIETALSLVHDAHVRVGENVAVFGQGLIGLLVTAILQLNHHPSTFSGKYGILTTFDTIPDRLAASSNMGATQALLPGGYLGPFDVTIEVSGNARALQSAIDCTAEGGRVVIGSWYGNTDVSLKLGMEFHRSHKTLITSQVSELPATVMGLWDKKRRFGLAWDLVRDLRPSRLLTKRLPLDDAMEAYQALENGTQLAIAFEYHLSRKF